MWYVISPQALHTVDLSCNNMTVMPMQLLQNASHVQHVIATSNPICLPPVSVCNTGRLPCSLASFCCTHHLTCMHRLAARSRLQFLIPPHPRAQSLQLPPHTVRRICRPRLAPCPALPLSYLAAAGFEPLVGAGGSREVAGHQPQS